MSGCISTSGKNTSLRSSHKTQTGQIMRKILGYNDIHSTIADQVQSYYSDVVDDVSAAVKENRVVVVGMRWNDAVWQARKNLKKAGVDFKYIEYGSYTSAWRKRLALKMWTGWPTFPMIFIDQKLIGGNSDLKKLIADGKI
jgi:glutaredoxin-related protein